MTARGNLQEYNEPVKGRLIYEYTPKLDTASGVHFLSGKRAVPVYNSNCVQRGRDREKFENHFL